MTRTLKLPTIISGNKDKNILLETVSTASEVYNSHTAYGFENESWNKKEMHRELYRALRAEHPRFPSALLQTMRDNACESLKSMHQNKKWRSQPKKREYSSIRYDKRTCTLNLETKEVTLAWVGDGRLKAHVTLPAYYERYMLWDIRSVQLVYRKDLKQFFLHVAVEAPAPLLIPGPALALDIGFNTFIYASNGDFIDGNELWSNREYYKTRRKELQELSTRSAKRKLRSISGREKRFVQNYVHCVVNKLLSKPYSVYVVEDLNHIRKQKKKSKQFNYRLSHWVYKKFDTILTYKAEQLGKRVIKVDPRYTSQTCSACGYVDKNNRKGQAFKCKACGLKLHADYNASLNILTAAVNQPNEIQSQGVVLGTEYRCKPRSLLRGS